MPQQMTAGEWLRRGLNLNNNSDVELHCYTEAIALKPGYAFALYVRGLTFKKRGNTARAETDLKQALELLNQAKGAALIDAYNQRGGAASLKADYDEAVFNYSEVLRLKPDDVDAILKRGNALQDKGDYVGAIADYNEALHLKPGDALICNNRGLARFNSGDT